jgi:hypothetical protein
MLAPYTLHCLKTGDGGYPNHPLYLRNELVPIVYRAAA